MAGAGKYAGRRVALLTQHGKQPVIAGVLEPALGCEIELVTGFDTDLLGTFTRETLRTGTQLEAARRKARIGMNLAGSPLGIASEGSFGADPVSGMLPWNIELVILIDDELGIEIVGSAQGSARNAHTGCGSWEEVCAFAEREDFPSQQLVLRPDGAEDTRIHKGIAGWNQLRHAFESALAASPTRRVFIELDLRAFANPARMRMIEQATRNLLQRIHATCPECNAPGFGITARLPGLPCAACGTPTSNYQSEVATCVRCTYHHVRAREDLSLADPAHCEYCNP